LAYDEPWGWMLPVRHALGALLLEDKKYEYAEDVFRTDLYFGYKSKFLKGNNCKRARCLVHPENPWALSGLAQALEAQKKFDEAKAISKKLEEIKKKNGTFEKLKKSCMCSLKDI